MNYDKTHKGHLAAFITILIWGTTFISTKVLLKTFSPVEILFIRFVMGYLALWLVCPRILRPDSRRQEPLFAAAGLCGITMYYLLENIALTYTLASNVGVIISIAPFFTAILSCLFLGGPRPGRHFFIGFLLAMAGIFLLSFGSSSLSINPMGDILAVAAAIIWAVYSTLTKKNKRPWLWHDPDHTAHIFLWAYLHDPGTGPYGLPCLTEPGHKPLKPLQPVVPGTGRVRPLLRHLEPGC